MALVEAMSTGDSAGYILTEVPKKGKELAEGAEAMYDEFHPTLFAQHATKVTLSTLIL